MRKPVREIDDNRILTPHQKTVLHEFIRSPLQGVFHLSGGTALSAFYLEHRLSEDLDFFSPEKIPLPAVEDFLKTLNNVNAISLAKQYDRNIFTLTIKDGTPLKVEFTHYPFPGIESPVTVQGLQIDGFLDIVVNKLCAIADRFDAKDYVDVYAAVTRAGSPLGDLFRLAEKKCGVAGIGHVLKNRLLQVPDGVDRLPLKITVERKEIEAFFTQQIRKMVEKEIR